MSIAAFFDREVTIAARELLGATFLVGGVGGRIVETEAYHPLDPASHSFIGPTARNASMFLGPGRVYVYRSYGVHWCVNFVCSNGAAILIRALEPTAGLDTMQRRRGVDNPRMLCSGPGRLTQALGIDRTHDGLSLDAPPFSLTIGSAPAAVAIGPRVGISKAIDVPWRFGLADSPYLSRRFAAPAE